MAFLYIIAPVKSLNSKQRLSVGPEASEARSIIKKIRVKLKQALLSLFSNEAIINLIRTIEKEKVCVKYRTQLLSENIMTSYGLYAATCEHGYFNKEQYNIEPDSLRNIINMKGTGMQSSKWEDGDSIFVVGERIEELAYYIAKRESNKKSLIIIIGRSDRDINEKCIQLLLSTGKVAHIFAQNCVYRMHSVTNIPLGIENNGFMGSTNPRNHPEIIKRILMQKQVNEYERVRRIIVAFSLHTNKKERVRAMKAAIKNQYCIYNPPRKGVLEDQIQFYENLCRYTHCLCPVGNGIDTHRFWLAYLFGALPVINNETLYKGLPGISYYCVNEWEDINKPEFIRKVEHYRWEHDNRILCLRLDYWANKILDVKRRIRQL
ncbi:hypothetical protein [Synechococcus sp. PROS-U-1]|uniref:hypothetical protein n=1 Tax=Synechococcus sp. PROS-U-1 TaxID=1400866 RepID=UPI001645310B|nr:hypothetical protein [Synechococcus sp. PROS-U-1]QNJ01755.1 hypothetical protein SynPROSU1_00108 [Synechococcus sp. PROS-U-1]